MKLYMTRSVSAGTTVFLVHDETGNHCASVRSLSGLLSDGFQLLGTFSGQTVVLYGTQTRLPHGRRFVITEGAQKRARVFLLPNDTVSSIRIDRTACTVLGQPLSGTYSLVGDNHAPIFCQQRQRRSGTTVTYELDIVREDAAAVCVAIAACLNQKITAARSVFTPVPAD